MIVELSKRIETELAKATTDEATYRFVQAFWQIDHDVPPELIDRVELLQSRMRDQHGWQV